ncbi:Pathogenicity locus [Providencia heimbachae]|uniref:helix-hairpin-helix domain-containing protein n=1 Tax=Providencia heimbachae TaxID=333962 RepID=UPI0010BF293F|nr:helix-hairpin-helix domain-containing protein [Providencia heimbachae]QCJ69462.1 Pathogenicity locus [Providencia heimbachae]
MAFSESEKQLLLSVKGVGPMVISRLEQMGFSSLAQLSEASYDEILISGAALTGSSCWKNSPQAKKAVEGAIAAAKQASTPSSI